MLAGALTALLERMAIKNCESGDGERGGSEPETAMTRFHKFVAGLAAMATLTSMPAQAGTMSNAEKLKRLDIMLMVTGLRCRATADDFQADFAAFEARHMAAINAAQASLRAEMAARYGRAGAENALDRLSVSMANQFGNGHPWLGCHDLKGAAQELAREPGEAPLIAAADQMLTGDDGTQLASADR